MKLTKIPLGTFSWDDEPLGVPPNTGMDDAPKPAEKAEPAQPEEPPAPKDVAELAIFISTEQPRFAWVIYDLDGGRSPRAKMLKRGVLGRAAIFLEEKDQTAFKLEIVTNTRAEVGELEQVFASRRFDGEEIFNRRRTRPTVKSDRGTCKIWSDDKERVVVITALIDWKEKDARGADILFLGLDEMDNLDILGNVMCLTKLHSGKIGFVVIRKPGITHQLIAGNGFYIIQNK